MTGAEVARLFTLCEPGRGDPEGLVDLHVIFRSTAFEVADRLPDCPDARQAVSRIREAFEYAESAVRCSSCTPEPVRVSSNPVPVD